MMRLSLKFFRSKKVISILLPSLAFLAILAYGYIFFRTNIHQVIPGKVFRSAQLSPEKLRQVVQQHHIQSVINLRGPNPETVWYQKEVTASHKMNVRHYDVRLSSQILPTTKVLRQLIEVLQTAPRPLLLHCLSGVDRTGLASAIVLILNNEPLQTAEQQFSWHYFVMSDKSVGKLVFSHYDAWLAKNHRAPTKNQFLDWAYSITPYETSNNKI
jgi:predicted protein tyrosine phosphatase